MSEDNETILEELRGVIEAQQGLLRLALWVMSQGPAVVQGQELNCVLEQDQARAASATSLGAGQSVNTILKGSNTVGIPVRDLYPISRPLSNCSRCGKGVHQRCIFRNTAG